MKKVIALLMLVSFVGVFSAEAGYYRTRNSFNGTYRSTGRTNNMGMRRAPAGYHTTSFGTIQKNSIGKKHPNQVIFSDCVFLYCGYRLAPIRARGAQDSLGRLCRHCAQTVTIWLHYLSPTKFEKFCGARCLPNLLVFEPATLLRMANRGPKTNIKTPTRGV